MSELSWKVVLYCHSWIGDLEIMIKYAKDLGYPYYMWNGIIYKTETLERTNFTVK